MAINNLKISVITLKDIAVSLLVVVISYGLGRLYVEGDQEHYISAYLAMQDTNLLDGFLIYKAHLSTEEPIHFLISWVSSSIFGVDKLILMSISNGLLAYLFVRIVKKLGGAPLIAYFLVVSNFYLWMLYLAGERFKFSFLFLLLAIQIREGQVISRIFYALSILSHLQILILFVSKFFEKFSLDLLKIFKNFSLQRAFLIYVVFSVVAFLFLFYALGDYFFWKVPQYLRSFGIASIWQVALFMALTLLYVKNKLNIFFFFVPILVASSFVGPERIVILAYFVFLFHAVQYRSGINYGVGLTTVYFGIKAVEFGINIVNSGQGFSEIP